MPHANHFAKIRAAIEAGDTRDAMTSAQNLVYQLGGTVDLSHMSSGAAALYLLSLALEQPTATGF